MAEALIAELLTISGNAGNGLDGDERNALAEAARLLGEVEMALEEIADGKLPPEKEGHYLAHRKCVKVARSALDKLRKGMGDG